MKKIVIGIVVLVLAVLILVSKKDTDLDFDNGKETIKIGVSLGLTGDVAKMGQANRVAVEMAIDKIKNMDTKYNYEFIFEDDAFDNKRTVQVMNKFVNLDKVKAVLSTYSKSHNIAKVYGDRGDFINLGCSWGDTTGEGDYNFNGYPSLKISVDSMISILNKKGISKLGILSTSSPGGVEMLNTWEKALKDSEINLVYNEKFNIGNKDYSMIVGKMKKQKIDILFLNMYTFEIDILLKEMQIQGVNIPLTTIEHFPFVTNLNALDGNWFISYLISSGDKFNEEYANRTDIPMQICVPQTYNDVMILVEAFENAKSSDISDVAYYINNMKEFDGVNGKLNINDKNFNSVNIPLAIIKDGKVEILEE